MDSDELRAVSRERWESSAEGWDRCGDVHAAGALPVAHWMVDRLHPQPGQTVVELAAGTGELGFLIAELLHPGGKLISTDGAEAMVDVARRRGQQRGITNVEFRSMEIEWLDLPAASVDGILCRFGYMLVVDPEAALRDARRVLRPSGRIALAVWDVPERNVALAGPFAAARELGLVAPPPVGVTEPGPFALSAPGAVAELLDSAGFDDVEFEALDLVFEAPSLEAWWNITTGLSGRLRELLAGLTPADIYRLRDAVDARWAPYVRDDGMVALPGRALCLAASA